MARRAHKEFIEPVTCVDGPVGEDKYLVYLTIGGEFIGTQMFKSMADIDAKLNEMKNDPDLIDGCKAEGLEPILVFEISEVKSPVERHTELQKEFKI